MYNVKDFLNAYWASLIKMYKMLGSKAISHAIGLYYGIIIGDSCKVAAKVLETLPREKCIKFLNDSCKLINDDKVILQSASEKLLQSFNNNEWREKIVHAMFSDLSEEERNTIFKLYVSLGNKFNYFSESIKSETKNIKPILNDFSNKVMKNSNKFTSVLKRAGYMKIIEELIQNITK